MNVQLLINALMVLFGLYIIRTYLLSFRQEAVCHKAYRRAAWTVYILFLYVIMLSGSKYPLLTLFGNIVLLAALLFAYGCGDVKTAIFRSCIYHVSRMAVEAAAQSILLTVLAEDSFVVENLISTLAMSIIIQMYRHWKGCDFTALLTFWDWVRLLFVPVSSMAIIHYAHMSALHSGQMAFFYFLDIFIILINYLIFDVYDKISALAFIERQNQAYEQDIRLCVRQAARREEAYQQTRILRHDLKGRLVALSTMLEAGQIEEVKKEIEKMLKENSLHRHGIAKTGNLALDAVVNYMYAAASAENIRMFCRLEVPAELFVESTDLCVILENLLGNALEAVQKLPRKERLVRLAVQFIREVLLITVENPYQEEILLDSHGRIRSSKPGDHGIGLLSVKRTAEKYDGEAFISYKDGLFRVSVVLFSGEVLHKSPFL